MCSEKQKHNLVLEQNGTKVLSEPEVTKQDNTRRRATEQDDYRYNGEWDQAKSRFGLHERQDSEVEDTEDMI